MATFSGTFKPYSGFLSIEFTLAVLYNQEVMKTNIHPEWYPEARVVCACGNTFTTGSTQEEIRVEICSVCHPFFTGQQKFIDSLGRVEKFQKKQASASRVPVVNKRKKKILKRIGETSEDKRPKTLKEMLTRK